MATKITGKNGKVFYYDTDSSGWLLLPATNGWSIELTLDEVDVTSFTESGVNWKDYKFVLKEWSGTIDGFVTDTDFPSIETGTSLNIMFNVDTNSGFRGTATLTGNSTNLPVSEAGTVSMSFRGESTLTIFDNQVNPRATNFSDWTLEDEWSVVDGVLTYTFVDGTTRAATLPSVTTATNDYIVAIKFGNINDSDSGNTQINIAVTGGIVYANTWYLKQYTATGTDLVLGGKAENIEIEDVFVYEVVK
jgi:hypothetical protein